MQHPALQLPQLSPVLCQRPAAIACTIFYHSNSAVARAPQLWEWQGQRRQGRPRKPLSPSCSNAAIHWSLWTALRRCLSLHCLCSSQHCPSRDTLSTVGSKLMLQRLCLSALCKCHQTFFWRSVDIVHCLTMQSMPGDLLHHATPML